MTATDVHREGDRPWPIVRTAAPNSSSFAWIGSAARRSTATDETGIDGVQRPFVLACKPEIQRMRQGAAWLYNLTHRENTAVVRWLRWLGFNFEARGHGPRGEFRLFWMPGAAKNDASRPTDPIAEGAPRGH